MLSRRATTEPIRRWLSGNWQDTLCVAALIALFLLVQRFVDGLDPGGDAVTKWQFVRQWSWQNDFRHATWNHHMTRMGVNVVAWCAQKLCGQGWRTYYVAPAFMAAAQLPLVYALGRRLSGRLCGFLAALIVIYLPAVHTSTSQLLPDGFAATYTVLAAYLLALYGAPSEPRRPALLVAAGVVAFVGYLAKETFFFFYPGFGIAVWLLRRRVRDVLVFAGVLLLGLALETACYALFTDYPNRLAIVRAVHFAGATDTDPTEVSFHGFFAIFRGLDRDWHYLLIVAALGASWLLVANRKTRRLGQACVVIAASHILLLGVSAQLWQNPLPRYMDPVVPLVALCGAFPLAAGVQALAARPKLTGALEGWLGARAWLLRSPTVGLALALIVTLKLGWLTARHQTKQRPFDGRAHGALMAKLVNSTYERNLPLVHRSRRAKTLAAAYDVYLDVPRLVRNGSLPNFEDVRRRHHEYTYLVKDPSVYSGKTFGELLDAGCVLELRNLKRSHIRTCVDVTRHTELPARCDELLASLARSPS